jgi:RNA polymerase sigma-70 factor (sigma-E family)
VGGDRDFAVFAVVAMPRLVRTAWLLTGDPHLAQDLAQETLIRVHQHWHRIVRSDAAGAYAHTTLVRLTRRQLALAHRRHESLIGTPPERAVEADAAEPLHHRLRAALLELPAGQREALVLRYFADLSVTATAESMRCDPGTVKSQCSKGLARLRALIDDCSGKAHALEVEP